MKNYLKVMLLALPVFASGCASSLMTPAPTQQVKAPSADKATVVFMRSSFVAGAIRAELFEVNNGDLKFIGVLANGTKIAYETSPGEKVFMTYGVAADFMKANLSAGKTYYVIARPNWGTGGFAPTPIRQDASAQYSTKSDDFKNWVADTELVVPVPEASTWFKENKPKMQEVYTTYWARFQTKSPDQMAERTMHPEDGR